MADMMGRENEAGMTDEIHQGRPSGAAVAAVLAAAIGLLVLALAHVQGERDEEFKEKLLELGETWIPEAEGIGPYSGKQTLMLVGWLASWGVLHVAMGKREVPVRPWFGLALGILLLAVLLLWPPFTHEVAAW